MFGQNDQNQQQPWQPQDTGQFTPPAAPVAEPITPAYQEPAAAPVGFTPPAAPAAFDATTAPAQTPEAESAPALPANGTVSTNDLLEIKQNALQELSPLVGHLEQSAEEKFRTTMMMIQASDDHNLLQAAYEAAKSIADEKARAQALLDVVNEINYFTQQHGE